MARAKSPRRPGAGLARAESYPGRIRIIGGQWRSRLLDVTSVPGLRPTPDRVRETVFNWLAPYVVGARCLDLFSGTGALCLEALSRGASQVIMVERSPDAAAQLRDNVARLGAHGADVVIADAIDYLAGRATPFDIIFVDPPFAVAETMIRACSERLSHGWTKPGSLVYIEAPRELALSVPEAWRPFKGGKAGQVSYSLFQVA